MKKSTPIVFGENFGKVFGEPWAELGKTIGKGISELFCEDSAIVLAPDGVRLNELNMTIPWDKVYGIREDEDDNTILVLFIGGLVAFTKSADCDVEDGWDKFFPDATADALDMNEEALCEAITKPDGINILKSEWKRRLTSAEIALETLKDLCEKTCFDCSISVPSAIAFGKVYVKLPDSAKQQIEDTDEVKAVLELWLALKESFDEKDEDDQAQIRDLKALITELDVTVATPGGQTSAGSSASGETPRGDYTREEALFLKRARRYATNDGEIDAKERADLEALAMKMGIDELRAEELIEEAFGQ